MIRLPVFLIGINNTTCVCDIPVMATFCPVCLETFAQLKPHDQDERSTRLNAVNSGKLQITFVLVLGS